MKRSILLFFVLVSDFLLANNFKVVGYLPHYRFEIADNIDFSKITDLNIAFLNPDIDGKLSVADKDIDPIIAIAKSMNPDLKVFVSIGGGGRTEEIKQAYNKFLLPENRAEFVHLLINYVHQHDLDGIDVDLEWEMVNEYYSPFVLNLADSLKSYGKQISAALPGTFRYADLSQEALDAYDFINLMVYDKTGPWRPNDPGPHSPRSFASESITYWRNQGLADSKMTLGVPFYGYDFTNQSNVTAFTFGSLISDNKHLAYTDQEGEKYYNGIPTIQYKTMLTMNEELAGVMIWELGQDAFGSIGEFSLLSAIDQVIQTGEVVITGVEAPLAMQKGRSIKIYPNPFQNELIISKGDDQENICVNIFDLQGRKQQSHILSESSVEHRFDLSHLSRGIYILEIMIDDFRYTEKIMKSS